MADLQYEEHIGHILCCTCGIQIKPNGANMCADCLKSSVDLTSELAKHSTVVYCKECGRYQKSTQWQAMELESAELLALCLKRFKGIEKLKLIDAGFVWTEPHSRRLKVKVTVQKDIAALNGVVVQQTFVIELVVTTQQCEDCQRSYTEHIWNSCVQIRQKADHKRTFLLLEQLILKHGMNQLIMYVQNAPGGLDMFFSSKSRALSMLEFITNVVPSRSKQSKRLISQDFKNNTANYKHTMLVDIVPICMLDLICLPKKVAQAAGGICPLLVCTKVSTMLNFVDPESMKSMELSASKFWANPFRPLCSARNLVEYMILDVVKTGVVHGKYAQAEVTCARSSDLSVNDVQFETITHLGNVLKPGDLASGYDLTSMVFNDDDLKAFGNAQLPDVVLVKKTYRRKNRAQRRKFKLHALMKVDDGEGKTDEEQHARDEEIFLRELEEDMELRCRVNLFKRDPEENAIVAADRAVEHSDEDAEDPDFPDVKLDELISNMDQLTHSPVDIQPSIDDDNSHDVGSKRRSNIN